MAAVVKPRIRIMAVARPVSATGAGAIERAISILGSQKALAEECGLSQQAISKWACVNRISAESAVAIHKATGGAISLHDLRPDLWPEAEPTREAA